MATVLEAAEKAMMKRYEAELKLIGTDAAARSGGNFKTAVNLFMAVVIERPGLMHYLLDETTKNNMARPYLPKMEAPKPPRKPPNTPATSVESLNKIAMDVHKSKLDTFMINGQPIGSVMVLEAREWAKHHGRDVRYVELLTGNLPLKGIIRDYRTAEDAEHLYKIAQKEMNHG